MDSTAIPVDGRQGNSADNGHFESTCDHPLRLFNREGDCLAGTLRPGNVHGAEDWEEPRRPASERQQQPGKAVGCRAGVRFSNKRGTAAPWITAGTRAVLRTRLRGQRLRLNAVRLWLSVIAYKLGNLWRRSVLPRRIEQWSLTSVQQRWMKTGGRQIKNARYDWLPLAESHLTRRLYGSMVRRSEALPVPAG